jgi:hypothetical protein
VSGDVEWHDITPLFPQGGRLRLSAGMRVWGTGRRGSVLVVGLEHVCGIMVDPTTIFGKVLHLQGDEGACGW